MFSDHFGNSLEFEPAPVMLRGFAYLFDRLLLVLFWVLIIYLVGKIADSDFGHSVSKTISHVDDGTAESNAFSEALTVVFIVIFSFAAYVVLFLPVTLVEYFSKGRSPGKLIFGLRIESSNGEAPTFSQVMIRSLIRDIEGTFGLLFIMATPNRQTFYDTLAGTVVIKSRKKKITDENMKDNKNSRRFILPLAFQHDALMWQRHYLELFSVAPASDAVRKYLVRQSADKLLKVIPPIEKYFPDEKKTSDMKKTENNLQTFSRALDKTEVLWVNP